MPTLPTIHSDADFQSLPVQKYFWDADGNVRLREHAGQQHWREAHIAGHAQPPSLEKLFSMLKAEWSLFWHGPVHSNVTKQRCQQCPHQVTDEDGRAFCAQCGCGNGDRAKLKMQMPLIDCTICGIKPAPGQGRKALTPELKTSIGQLIKSTIAQIRVARKVRYREEGDGL